VQPALDLPSPAVMIALAPNYRTVIVSAGLQGVVPAAWPKQFAFWAGNIEYCEVHSVFWWYECMYIYIITHTHIYIIYIYTYLCVCICTHTHASTHNSIPSVCVLQACACTHAPHACKCMSIINPWNDGPYVTMEWEPPGGDGE
jgi:hypothetical protein